MILPLFVAGLGREGKGTKKQKDIFGKLKLFRNLYCNCLDSNTTTAVTTHNEGVPVKSSLPIFYCLWKWVVQKQSSTHILISTV